MTEFCYFSGGTLHNYVTIPLIVGERYVILLKSFITDLELMKSGKAPIGKDGKPINLHHLIQKEPGTMLEILHTTHKEYHKVLHQLVEKGDSFRNNPELQQQYDNFRRKYWMWRAEEYEKSLKGGSQ